MVGVEKIRKSAAAIPKKYLLPFFPKKYNNTPTTRKKLIRERAEQKNFIKDSINLPS